MGVVLRGTDEESSLEFVGKRIVAVGEDLPAIYVFVAENLARSEKRHSPGEVLPAVETAQECLVARMKRLLPLLLRLRDRGFGRGCSWTRRRMNIALALPLFLLDAQGFFDDGAVPLGEFHFILVRDAA